MPLHVWADRQLVGTLDRLNKKGTTFSYLPGVPECHAVSLTMPPRVQSYDLPFDLLPVFDMNLPEGAVRERLRNQFAKATGSFDEFDILGVTGRSQIGRVRLTPEGVDLDETVPFRSVDEILRAQRGGELYDYLMDTYARYSGLSGVQPKVMIQGERNSPSIKGATHIVKFWDPDEYPELAANEYFCLKAAARLGLEVPKVELSQDGGALVVERFDRSPDGSYRGFEDMAVLNGSVAAEKYAGGYETKLFRRVKDNLPPSEQMKGMETLFRLFALNCAVRNGDAHLKNFGLVYETPQMGFKVAPTYDVVTTTAYLPKDRMALTLNGSTDWPDRKKLIQLAGTRAALPPAKAGAILEQVADIMADVAAEARAYFADCPHPEVGDRMLASWDEGIRTSLGFADRASLAPEEAVPAHGPRP